MLKLKQTFLMFFLGLLLFSCGNEKSKVESGENNPSSNDNKENSQSNKKATEKKSIDAFAFVKEKSSDYAVFMKNHEDQNVSIENLYIGSVFDDKEGNRIVNVYPFNPNTSYEKTEINQTLGKKIWLDFHGENKMNLPWSNFINLNDKLYPAGAMEVFYQIKVKLNDPATVSKKGLSKSDLDMKEEILDNNKTIIINNPKICKVSGVVRIEQKQNKAGFKNNLIILEEGQVEILDK